MGIFQLKVPLEGVQVINCKYSTPDDDAGAADEVARRASIDGMAHEVRHLTVQADAHRQALLRQTQCRKLRDLHDRS